MKYNRSEIMSRAQEIRRNGATLSTALTQAWTEAKVANIDNELFMLNMIDRQTNVNKARVNVLDAQRAELVKTLPKSQEELESETKANEKAAKQLAINEELDDIQWALSRIIRAKNPDWNQYKELRARQAELKTA